MDSETISRFDKASEQYSTGSIKYRKLAADRVSLLAAPSLSDVILDIGCGTGRQLIELSAKIKSGIGIDISSGMVQKANEEKMKAGCTNLEFYVGDFLALEKAMPHEKIKVNKVISNYALHHLSYAEKKTALEKIINLTIENLEMIVIGDLMFFDDPAKYSHQYDQIGYGPGVDLPSYAEELAGLFDKGNFAITVEQIHPLVGVLTAEKRRK